MAIEYNLIKTITVYEEFMMSLRYAKNPCASGIGARRGDIFFNENNRAKGRYGYVPSKDPKMLLNTFSLIVNYLRQTNDKGLHFLDAGCGAGNVLLLAYISGFTKVSGIDIDNQSLDLAKRLMTSAHIDNYNLINVELEKYKNYHQHNVIYYYQPFYNNNMETFLNILKDGMAVKTVVVVNGSDTFKNDSRFKEILNEPHHISHYPMYEKITAGAQG